MHQSIGKILPSDGFTTNKNAQLLSDHYQALFQLYQPIIGVTATSLYVTLSTQFQDKQLLSHHHLMQTLDQPLNKIYQARLKCEAIGLLTTHQLDNGQHTVYRYQLNLPCTVQRFLNDDLLSQLLYHQIGKDKYEALVKNIKTSEQQPNIEGEDITAHFTDVFHSKKYVSHITENDSIIEPGKPVLDNLEIDWQWLKKMLDDRMLPANKILSESNCRLIRQMTALYHLTTTQLEKALQWSISTDHELNREEFKTACLDLVETISGTTDVVEQREKITTTNSDQSPKSKQALFIERMETISPKELLEDLSNGSRASNQDLKMIAGVMDAQGLNPSVMNVLIHYVMLKTDMKLTKSYLEKIASHWSRKNVKTAQQAITLAKSEHNKYQQWGQNYQPKYTKPSNRKEVVPDWFKQQKQARAKKVTNPSSEATEDVSELLKAFQDKKTNQ
ncbi:DnaD domain protein [Amphibacillus cookii]|uniref:DnaD domain protein n=1 Tax=Amphibacillus cookii TaxID=767787 RepID=UPI0019564A6B|nr:replication initiation and membrane attachment protein [Amphibacillus cookii]